MVSQCLTQKEKFEQVKSDFKSLERWKKEKKNVDDELIAINVKLLGVGSLPIKEIVVSCGPKTYNDQHKLELMEIEEQLVKERDRLQANIDITLIRLSNVKDHTEKSMINDLYIKNKYNDEQIAQKYGYCRMSMYRRLLTLFAEIY